jgi:DNA 3'-phosphatase
VPISALISTEDDQYRKPRLGMFNFLEKHAKKLDKEKFIYCGDAAGRLKPKKDHSASD